MTGLAGILGVWGMVVVLVLVVVVWWWWHAENTDITTSTSVDSEFSPLSTARRVQTNHM